MIEIFENQLWSLSCPRIRPERWPMGVLQLFIADINFIGLLSLRLIFLSFGHFLHEQV